jgi:hypothetical protein
MENREIKEKLSEGYLHIRAIIEVVGKPKDYVQKTIKDYVDKIKKEYLITNIDLEKVEEHEGFFSTFAELEILFKNLKDLLSFCYGFMPSSLEILDPTHLNIESTIFTDFLNDNQARMHGLNTGLLQTRDQAQLYVKNSAVLLRNFLVVLLARQPMKIEDIVPLMGVQAKDIDSVLGVLIKEGKVKKEDNVYSIIKQNK